MNKGNEPLVSIVMPSFNSEKHIRESIDSILSQTYSNWELIIVDGRSKDDTISIINEYISSDSRIKLIYDEGKGLGAALNQGCKLCKGEFIARMDTDDIAIENRLQVQSHYLQLHDDVVLVSGMAIEIDEGGAQIGYGITYTNEKLLTKHVSNIYHSCIMMRRDVYEKAGGYPPIKRAEDAFLWYRLSRFGRLNVLPAFLIKYRITEGALSGTVSEFFKKHSSSLWNVVANKEILDDRDFNYLNTFIEQNLLKDPFRENRVRSIQDKFYAVLATFFPKRYAISIVASVKNIYGIIKYTGLK